MIICLYRNKYKPQVRVLYCIRSAWWAGQLKWVKGRTSFLVQHDLWEPKTDFIKFTYQHVGLRPSRPTGLCRQEVVGSGLTCCWEHCHGSWPPRPGSDGSCSVLETSVVWRVDLVTSMFAFNVCVGSQSSRSLFSKVRSCRKRDLNLLFNDFCTSNLKLTKTVSSDPSEVKD